MLKYNNKIASLILINNVFPYKQCFFGSCLNVFKVMFLFIEVGYLFHAEKQFMRDFSAPS